jgi:hypothetical protein
MKRILVLFMLWLSVLILNGCVAVMYPDGYWQWPEERRSEWRGHNRLRPWQHYENRREEHHERRFEEHRMK